MPRSDYKGKYPFAKPTRRQIDYMLYLVKQTEYMWLSNASKHLFKRNIHPTYMSRRQASDMIEHLKEKQLSEDEMKRVVQEYRDKNKA